MNLVLDGELSILLTDHGDLCRRLGHVLSRIFRSVPAAYRIVRLCGSEDSDQRLCKASGGETEESAISSRTSNHRLDCLMELFGNCKGFHPRNQKAQGTYRRSYGSLTADGWMRMGRSSQGPICRIKPVSFDLCYPSSRSLYLLSRMTSSTIVLRQLKLPVLRLHFSSSDVRETTLFEEGEPKYRYKVSTSRPTSHSGNKVTTVSDSRGMPIIVFRWNTYKRDEIDWVKPRHAGSPPVIKRPISAFFKMGR